MDAELKAKWVAALRSGEYKQTQYRLKDDSGSLCCLGVCCVVSGLGDWRRNYLGLEFYYTADGVAVMDDEHVKDVTGITKDQKYALIDMNDKEGKSFNEIADYIEANL